MTLATAPAALAPEFPRWSTASASDAPDTTPGELSELGDHALHCRGAQGRFFRAHCAAESLSGFLAPRFMTTVVVVALAFGIVSLIA